MYDRNMAKADITLEEVRAARSVAEKFLPAPLMSKIMQAANLSRPRTSRRRSYDMLRAAVDWCERHPGVVSFNHAAPPARNPPPLVVFDPEKTDEILEELNKKSAPVAPVERALDVQVGGSHYKQFEIQPAEIAEKNKLSFLEACVVKRLHRHSRGGKGIEDIKKSIHELRLLAKLQYGVDL